MKKIIKGKRINIDKVRYLPFVDTETIGSIYVKESCLPFEIGLKIYDTLEKKVVYEKSFIVKRFFNNKYIMLSTFSATKYPQYQELIKDKKHYFIGSVKDIFKQIERVLKRFNATLMVAHNGQFDKDALERLGEEFACYNPFSELDLLDTMEISQVITNSKEYVSFCKRNKHIKNVMGESAFITNSGRVRLTAQAIYAFIIDNPNYQESHTALRDIDDEIRIFQESSDRLGNRLVRLNIAPVWQEYEN